MGMEGGHSIENSLGVLRQLYAAGARYMTLTHSLGTLWADSGTDEARVGGLSAFGEEVVREMNRMGMLVDIAHTSPETMHDALDVAVAPVIFSHASAKGVCDHPRNVPDDVLERLPDNGGVVMVTFVPRYISGELAEHSDRRNAARRELQEEYADDPSALGAALREWDQRYPAPVATLEQVADHIDHVKRVAGVDHVGIGGDYDGIRNVPQGLEDVSKYPDLIAELCERGWSDEEIRKLLGLNLLRVMRACESVAAELQAERPASEKTIQELDGIDPWG
jgi:membrane dipeptidase